MIKDVNLFELLATVPLSDLRLKLVATLINSSQSWASEFFKKILGQTFREWHKERILQEAKRLFKDDGLTIQTISQTLGYSKKGFDKFFKRYAGLTAFQYRRQILKEGIYKPGDFPPFR